MILSLPETVRVLLPDGKVHRMALEAYVQGVVSAALPADTPVEALKAQAVAARTFGAATRRHIERGADVCTLRHCQVWQANSEPQIVTAAEATRNVVALFNGRLIDAYYFEHCDGSTRDAAGVLVQAPAYLKSVACPCGFASMKGHGVGMCQRGAVVMARFGDSFDAILRHYYSGVTLERAGLPLRLATPPAVEKPKPAQPATVNPKSAPAGADKPNAARAPAAKSNAAPAPAAKPKSSAPRRTAQQATRVAASQTKKTKRSPTVPASEKPASAQHDKAETEPRVVGGPKPEATEEKKLPVQGEAAAGVAKVPTGVVESKQVHLKPEAEVQEPKPVAPPVKTKAEPSAKVETAQLKPEAINGKAEAEPQPTAEKPKAQVQASVGLKESGPEVVPKGIEVPPVLKRPVVALSATELARPLPPPPPPPPPQVVPESTPEAMRVAPKAASKRVPDDPESMAIAIDHLPGPRVIAGDLSKSGIIVTIRDSAGNTVVTVSGTAPHHGVGGFEAPLIQDGAYSVTFDHKAVQLELKEETVFLCVPG